MSKSDQQGQGDDETVKTPTQLDFGWFKVSKSPVQDSPHTPIPAGGGGGAPPDGLAAVAASPAPSDTVGHHQQHRPPTGDGRRSMSQASCSAEEAGRAYQRINESTYREPVPSQQYDENIVIDWPLSNIEAENLQRPSSSTNGLNPPNNPKPINTPTTSESERVLATPMPPLNLEGYGQNTRPTYASWRESWHRERDRFDCNNNNNNSSNNNVDDALLDRNTKQRTHDDVIVSYSSMEEMTYTGGKKHNLSI